MPVAKRSVKSAPQPEPVIEVETASAPIAVPDNTANLEAWQKEMVAFGVSPEVIQFCQMFLASDKKYVGFRCEYPPSVAHDDQGGMKIFTPFTNRFRILPSVGEKHPEWLRYNNPNSENLPGQLMPLFYTPNYDELFAAVKMAGGNIKFVEGASDVWTLLSTGLRNVSGFIAAGGSYLDDLTKQLIALGVKSIDFYPDLDTAGVAGTYKLVKHFAETSIAFTVRHIPFEIDGHDVKDIRTIARAINFDGPRLLNILDACPKIDYEFKASMREAGLPAGHKYGTEVWKSNFFKDVVLEKLGLDEHDFKPNTAWSKNIACPFHEHAHDDTKPGFGWNKTQNYGKCFKSGEVFSAYDLCKQFGINWRDWVVRDDKTSPTADANYRATSFEAYKTGQVGRQESTGPMFTYMDEALDRRDLRVSGAMPSPYPPIINPFTPIHDLGGYAAILSRPRLVGLFAPSGGFKTSLGFWGVSNLVQNGEHGIIYSPEWNSDESIDRFVQMHGGLGFLEIQKLDLHYHERLLESKGQLPIDYNMYGRMPDEVRMEQDAKVARQIKRRFIGKMAFINGFKTNLWDVLIAIQETAEQMTKDGHPPSWVLLDYVQLLAPPPGQGSYWKLDTSIDRLKELLFSMGLVGFLTAQIRKSDAEKARSNENPDVIMTTSGNGFSDYPFNLILSIKAPPAEVMEFDGRQLRIAKLIVGKNSGGRTTPSLDEAKDLYIDTQSLNFYSSREDLRNNLPFYQLPEDIEF